MMKSISVEIMAKTEGGRFWGTGYTTECNSRICITCAHDYYFWIKSNSYNCKVTPVN